MKKWYFSVYALGLFFSAAAEDLTYPTYAISCTATPEPSIKRFVSMAPVQNKITWDLHWSPYSGGENLLFADRILEKIETYLFRNSPIASAKTASARFWRLNELIGIWLPINYFAMVLQHEVFGHGYRIRDLHTHNAAKVDGYSFNGPPPYGSGGAATYFSTSDHFTTTEGAAVASSGVEGTAILALLTKLKWLEPKKIDPRQTILYLLCEQDLTLYISTLKAKGIDLEGHDIDNYIRCLNYTYPDHLLNKGRLRSLSWINLADPFSFYAVYAWFRYLASGKETKIPMIGACYLPGFRLGLTPFGPEVFFESFFVRNRIPLYAYIKGGRHAENNYWGAGIFAPKLWNTWRWFFGLRLDLWRQPKLLLQPGATSFDDLDLHQKPSTSAPLYPDSERHAIRLGASGSLIIFYQAHEQCGYEMEFGVKSQGFLPGYSLFSYPTIRISLNVNF